MSYPLPPYEKYEIHGRGSRWNPKHWSRGVRIAVAVAVFLVILLIILGSVLGAKANAYPDYSALKFRLEDTFHGVDFFDNFDFFTGYDPASCFVHYVPRETAISEQYNLIYASSESAVLRVDTSQANASTGRYSVRITSKKQYNSGLFVFDVMNTPCGCSTWPALWLTDPSNWPENGRD